MKILLLTPVHKEYNGKLIKKNDGIPQDQGQFSWISAFRRLGHTVQVFIYTDSIIIPKNIQGAVVSFFDRRFPIFTGRVRRRLENFYKYNPDVLLKSMRFEKDARLFKPDIIIISGGITSLQVFSIKKIKDAFQAQVYLFSGINSKTSSTKLERDLIKKGVIDLVIENDNGYAKAWRDIGAKVMVLPISSIDPSKHKKIKLTKNEQEEYGCEVCFVGSLTLDRIKKLKQFIKFDFKFWGDLKPGVKIPSSLQKFYQGTAHGEKVIKIFNAAKIVLNFQPADMTTGGNMRTFEISGSGAFQLADKVDSSWFTDKKDVVLFSDLKDAVKKLNFYLSHEKERKKIRENGFQRTHKDHTYEKHFKKLPDLKL